MLKHANPNLSREEVALMLREYHITPTHQRIEIAHTLFSRCEHLSAEQIMASVNLRHPEASKATIYNTLKLFREKGLIREVIVDPSKVFYDPNTTPHHHFFNVESGELTDIHADAMQLSGLPQLPHGMVADSVDIIVRIRPAAA